MDVRCLQEFTEDTLSGGLSLEERVVAYTAERERRVKNFVLSESKERTVHGESLYYKCITNLLFLNFEWV